MSAVILSFVPRAVAKPPQARTRAVPGIAEQIGAQWSARHMPLVTVALEMLQTDDGDFAERCHLIASEPGALIRLVDQLSRFAGHMTDVAEALAMTVQRIRSAMLAQTGQPA